MQNPEQKRIDQAWESSQEWVTEFDGTPNIALLVDVPAGSLMHSLRTLVQQAENFRITTVPSGDPHATQFIPIETTASALEQLQEGKLVELSINYAVRLEAFDLDIHMVVHAMPDQKVALEIDWWSDQVFSEETDNPAQFAALMHYFLGLQALFASPHLFISPESGKDPSDGAESWVEV